VRIFALPFFIIPLFIFPEIITELPHLSASFWISAIYVSMISTPIEMLLWYMALKKEDVTFLIPLLSLSPLVAIGFGFILFQEIPTITGLLGVFIIITGIYVLELKKAKEGALEPFKHILKKKAVRFIIPMLLLYGADFAIDKVAIVNSSIALYLFVNYTLVSLVLFIIASIKAKNYFSQIKTYFGVFVLMGIIVAGYTALRFFAIENGNVGYVATVLSSSILFTALFGTLYLKEKGFLIKLLSGSIIFVGLILIKLFG